MELTPDELIDGERDRYYTSAAFARAQYEDLVKSDPYLNSMVSQLEDLDELILRRIKNLVARSE